MFRLPDSWVWDFWLAEQDGTYHLFFLHASRSLHDPDRRHLRAAIGHATSTDLVHWEQVTDALVHGDPGEFDATATWTGSVIKGPDGQWFMFYTGTTQTPEGALIQQVGLATSTDLHHWVKDKRNPLVRADSRWYETLGGEAPWQDEHWRDPFVMADPDGNGWHLLITARANTGPLDDRGVIAHAHSTDLLHWEVQPPLSEPGAGFGHLEVVQVANVDGRNVLIFNCLPGEYSAARLATGERGAIWAAAGETPLGPFDINGATPLTDDSLYVGKLVRDPSGAWVLLAFHNNGVDGDFGGMLSDPMVVRWDGNNLVIDQERSTAIAPRPGRPQVAELAGSAPLSPTAPGAERVGDPARSAPGLGEFRTAGLQQTGVTRAVRRVRPNEGDPTQGRSTIMKRMGAAVFAVGAALAFAACGSSGANGSPTSAAGTSAAQGRIEPGANPEVGLR